MLFDKLEGSQKKKLIKCSFPQWVDPMLATLSDKVFSDSGWLFERKLDGERCITYRQNGSTRLMSRNRKIINSPYPEIKRAFDEIHFDFIADGEIVAFDNNTTSFSTLQKRLHVERPLPSLINRVPVYIDLFDILFLDGYDTKRLKQITRKNLLKNTFNFTDPVRYTSHHNENGADFYNKACRNGWEGIIAKCSEAVYSGKRSRNWLKFKCTLRQEFIICGYTQPQGHRKGFGSLLLGYYSNGVLEYAGKVGTGFNDESLVKMKQKLVLLHTDANKFGYNNIQESNIHRVKPKLVCDVSFTEWTQSGRLRHPCFIGLRHDKEPAQVVKEEFTFSKP